LKDPRGGRGFCRRAPSFARTKTMSPDSCGFSRIELLARRQEDLSQGCPDFHIYAGNQLVGRIYQTHFTDLSQGWFWGINGLTVDLSIDAVMHGHAAGFSEAKTKLRAAFNSWVEWAEAVPKDDLKYPSVAAQLKAMDVA
jgi:hypothetical protein